MAPLTPEHIAELRGYLSQPDVTFGRITVSDLLDTIEAQAACLQRFRDGWRPRWRGDGSRAWQLDSYYPPKWLPMTDTEQAVIDAIRGGSVAREDTTPRCERCDAPMAAVPELGGGLLECPACGAMADTAREDTTP